MFRKIFNWNEKKSEPEEPQGIPLTVIGSSTDLEDQDLEVKVSAKENLAPEREPNLFDNLKKSVAALETQLRHELEKIMDPAVYKRVIAEGVKDSSGYRYAVVTTDKNDRLYYYQNVLNLLMDFQWLMDPVGELHGNITKLQGSRTAWSKARIFWRKKDQLNEVFNTFSTFYLNFLSSFAELELDTVLGRLPAFNEVTALLKELTLVKNVTAHVLGNPLVDSSIRKGAEWRKLFPSWLPAQETVEGEGDEEDDENPEEKESKREAKIESKETGLAEQKGLPQAPPGEWQTLQDLSNKMALIQIALHQIISDLAGQELSSSVKEDINKTLGYATRAIQILQVFSQKRPSWLNVVGLAIVLYPVVKALLASVPQSYLSINKTLRETLLTTVRQFNLILRDCFLFADRMEGEFYLRDGLLLNFGAASCGLFQMKENPLAPVAKEKLNRMLGTGQDGYVFYENKLYYVNRYLSKQSKTYGINVKELLFRERREKDSKEKAIAYGPDHLRQGLNIPLLVDSEQSYLGVHRNLRPRQLELIRAMTQPSGSTLTGRYRAPGLYAQTSYSLAELAKGFNSGVESLGYEFKAEERFPYTREMLAQRETMLEKKRETQEEKARGGPGTAFQEEFLEQRFRAKQNALMEEAARVEADRQVQALELSRYQANLIRAQIDKRTHDLGVEIKASGAKFPDPRRRQRALWGYLKIKLLNNSSLCWKELFLSLSPKQRSLLRDEPTRKLAHTLSLIRAKPADRDALLRDELTALAQEHTAAGHSWFFAQSRQTKLNLRMAALRELRGLLVRPGYRTQEVLVEIRATKPDLYAVLLYEKKLLTQLKEIDQFIPDLVLGKKQMDSAEPLIQRLEAERRTRSASGDKPQEAPSSPRSSHFFASSKARALPESSRGSQVGRAIIDWGPVPVVTRLQTGNRTDVSSAGSQEVPQSSRGSQVGRAIIDWRPVPVVTRLQTGSRTDVSSAGSQEVPRSPHGIPS